jgi:acyl carrier protein
MIGEFVMKAQREETLEYVLGILQEVSRDWDYSSPVNASSLLFTELGFESLDAVVLATKIQEHYDRHMPFAELFAELGQTQRDLSIGELVDFVNKSLGDDAGKDGAGRN